LIGKSENGKMGYQRIRGRLNMSDRKVLLIAKEDASSFLSNYENVAKIILDHMIKNGLSTLECHDEYTPYVALGKELVKIEPKNKNMYDVGNSVVYAILGSESEVLQKGRSYISDDPFSDYVVYSVNEESGVLSEQAS